MYYLLHCCSSSHCKTLHLEQIITLTFIVTPDSAPLGLPLPCRPFNKNVYDIVLNIGTMGTTRCSCRSGLYNLSSHDPVPFFSSGDHASGQSLTIVWQYSRPAGLNNSKYNLAFMKELLLHAPSTYCIITV